MDVKATINVNLEQGRGTYGDYGVTCSDPSVDADMNSDQEHVEDMMTFICATILSAILMDKQGRGGQTAMEGIEEFKEKVIKMTQLYRGSEAYVDPKKN